MTYITQVTEPLLGWVLDLCLCMIDIQVLELLIYLFGIYQFNQYRSIINDFSMNNTHLLVVHISVFLLFLLHSKQSVALIYSVPMVTRMSVTSMGLVL